MNVVKNRSLVLLFYFWDGVKMKKPWHSILLATMLTAMTAGTTLATNAPKKATASSTSASVPTKTELMALNSASKKLLPGYLHNGIKDLVLAKQKSPEKNSSSVS